MYYFNNHSVQIEIVLLVLEIVIERNLVRFRQKLRLEPKFRFWFRQDLRFRLRQTFGSKVNQNLIKNELKFGNFIT
jgi:hypothetical protein